MADEAFDGSIYTIESAHAKGKFLNVEENSESNGANVQLWENSRTTATQWRLKKVKTGIYSIENVVAKEKYLSAEDTSNGANVEMWDNPEESSTQWRLVQASAGLYTIESVSAKGKFLNVEDDWKTNGANIQVKDDPKSLASQWKVEKAGFIAKLTTHKGFRVGFAYLEGERIEVAQEMNDTLIEKWSLRNPNKEVKGGDLIVEVNGKTDLAEMWKERETETLEMRIVQAPPKPKKAREVPPSLVLALGSSALHGCFMVSTYYTNVDIEDKRQHAEIFWVIALVLCLAAWGSVFQKIGQMPSGGRKVRCCQQTTQEYDKSLFSMHFAFFAMSTVIFGLINYSGQSPLYLFVHTIMVSLQVFPSRLFQLHILGSYVKRPFVPWIPLPSFASQKKNN